MLDTESQTLRAGLTKAFYVCKRIVYVGERINMVSLTLSIPLELKTKMAQYPHIKWSEVVRAILWQEVIDLEEANRLASKSKLTEKDVEEFSQKVNADMAKHFQRLGNATGY